MAKKIRTLSEDDFQLLRGVVDLVKSGRLNPQNRPAVEDDVNQAPETYIAKTPAAGIPKLTGATGTGSGTSYGDRPGSAICRISQIVNSSTLATVESFHKTVYNLSRSKIDGNVWIPVIRDKFGNWLAIAPASAGSGGGSGLTATIVEDFYREACVAGALEREISTETITITNGLITSWVATPYAYESTQGCCACHGTGTIHPGTSTLVPSVTCCPGLPLQLEVVMTGGAVGYCDNAGWRFTVTWNPSVRGWTYGNYRDTSTEPYIQLACYPSAVPTCFDFYLAFVFQGNVIPLNSAPISCSCSPFCLTFQSTRCGDDPEGDGTIKVSTVGGSCLACPIDPSICLGLQFIGAGDFGPVVIYDDGGGSVASYDGTLGSQLSQQIVLCHSDTFNHGNLSWEWTGGVSVEAFGCPGGATPAGVPNCVRGQTLQLYQDAYGRWTLTVTGSFGRISAKYQASAANVGWNGVAPIAFAKVYESSIDGYATWPSSVTIGKVDCEITRHNSAGLMCVHVTNPNSGGTTFPQSGYYQLHQIGAQPCVDGWQGPTPETEGIPFFGLSYQNGLWALAMVFSPTTGITGWMLRPTETTSPFKLTFVSDAYVNAYIAGGAAVTFEVTQGSCSGAGTGTSTGTTSTCNPVSFGLGSSGTTGTTVSVSFGAFATESMLIAIVTAVTATADVPFTSVVLGANGFTFGGNQFTQSPAGTFLHMEFWYLHVASSSASSVVATASASANLTMQLVRVTNLHSWTTVGGSQGFGNGSTDQPRAQSAGSISGCAYLQAAFLQARTGAAPTGNWFSPFTSGGMDVSYAIGGVDVRVTEGSDDGNFLPVPVTALLTGGSQDGWCGMLLGFK